MKRIPCQYAIARFQPFIETGEFANVGIVMIAPKLGFFNFELFTKRYGRITRFFKLEPRIFGAAMQNLKDDLERIANMLKTKHNDIEFAKNIFLEIIRPRETIVRFSNPRVVLAEDPKATLKELFGFYVKRNFVTKKYQEDLVKGIRSLLDEAGIGDRFKKRAITGNLNYQVNFPFVELRNERAFKIIKPLSLDQEKTEKIIDQGIEWGARIRELKRQDTLPQKVLFAVNGPDGSSERGRAYKIAVERLKEAEIDVIPYNDKEEILKFARSD